MTNNSELEQLMQVSLYLLCFTAYVIILYKENVAFIAIDGFETPSNVLL